MGLRAIANLLAGGYPASFTTLTVSGNATIGGDLGVTGLIRSNTSVSVRKDGSDTIGSGAFFQLANGADTRSWVSQLSASNNLDWWAYDVSWAKYMTLSTTGLAVTGSISATNAASNVSVGAIQSSAVDGFSGVEYKDAAGTTKAYIGLEQNGISDGVRINAIGATGTLYQNGSGKLQWGAGGVTVTGLTTTDTLRVNVTPTAEVVVATHTAVFNINGTNYKFLCLAA